MSASLNHCRASASLFLICMAAASRAPAENSRTRGPFFDQKAIQPGAARTIRLPANASSRTGTEAGTTVLPAQNLMLGDVRTLHFPSISRIAVGNGKVINAAAISGTEVLVIAESNGFSALNVWDKRGREYRTMLRVGPEDVVRSVRELTSLLNDIPGISLRIVGNRVIVEGHNLSGAARSRVEALVSQFPNLINLTHPVTWEKMILFDVRIVEFNKQALSELGIRWSDVASGPALAYARDWAHNPAFRAGKPGELTPLPGPGLLQNLDNSHSYFGIVTSLTSQIDLMARDGKAVVLAEPRLSARSGSTAHFLAGGEIPLPVRGDNGEVNVFFKEYGIILDIRPEAGGDGTVRASVKAELSTIDNSTSVSGFPGFLKRQTSTEVNLKEGETLVISGLVSAEMSRDVSKMPYLADIPILGALFRSKNFRDRQSELVFFVTPHIVDATTPINQEIHQQTQQRLQGIRRQLQKNGGQ